jgi:hypothetical protein
MGRTYITQLMRANPSVPSPIKFGLDRLGAGGGLDGRDFRRTESEPSRKLARHIRWVSRALVDCRVDLEIALAVQPYGAGARCKAIWLSESPPRCNLVVTRKYVRGVLPWLLLGPLTGLLAEGAIRNWRAGEISLAWLYGLALWLTTFDLYSLGGRLALMTAQLHIGW